MSPQDIVKKITNVIEEYKHGENITPQRRIKGLLMPLRGLTIYTDEMIENLQRASDNFYGETGLNSAGPTQFRYELLAAVHRLKNAVSMMEEQLPADIPIDVQ